MQQENKKGNPVNYALLVINYQRIVQAIAQMFNGQIPARSGKYKERYE